MKKIKQSIASILFVCLFTLGAIKGNANPPVQPTTLSAGDVLCTGFNSFTTGASSLKYFQFVLLKDVTTGTTFKMSGNTFNSNTATSGGLATAIVRGGIVKWVATSNLPKGTAINYTVDTKGSVSANVGSASILTGCSCSTEKVYANLTTAGKMLLYYSPNGDGTGAGQDFTTNNSNNTVATFKGTLLSLTAYQGASSFTDFATTSDNNVPFLPSDASTSTSALFLANNTAFGYYNGIRSFASIAAARAAVLDPTQWSTFPSITGSTGTGPLTGGDFSFGTPNSAPTFSNSTNTLTVCQNSTATSINSLLQITDADASQNEAFSVSTQPNHGGSITTGTNATSGTNQSPTGWSYAPAPGFSGTETFTIQVSDGIATANTTVTVTVNPLANAGTISGASSVCSNGATTLSSNGASGGLWSSSATDVASVNASGSVSGVSAGNATISYSVTNGCGTVTATKNITVTQATFISIQPPSRSAVCEGSGITEPITALGVNLTYQWQASTDGTNYNNISDGGIYSGTNTSTLTISNVTSSNSGTKHRCVVTGNCGTATSLGKTLLVKASHTITASAGAGGSITNAGTTSVCDGNDAPLYIISANSGYYLVDVLVDGSSVGAVTSRNFFAVTADHTISATFALNCVPSSSSTSQTACGSYTWNGTTYTASGTYTYTTKNAGGCDSTATLSLTIKQVSTSSDSVNACTSYTWHGTTYTASGNYTYTTTNAIGCDSVVTLKLHLKAPTDVVTVSGVNNTCVDGTVSKLTSNFIGGIWSTKSSSITVNTSGFVAGNGTVNAFDTVKYYCSIDSATMFFSYLPYTVIGSKPITGYGPVCTGSTLQLQTKVLTYPQNIENGTVGVWSVQNTARGTITSTGLFTAGTTGGHPNVVYTLTNKLGCVRNLFDTSIVINALPTTKPTITGPAAVCTQNTVQLSASPAGASNTWGVQNSIRGSINNAGLLIGASPNANAIVTYKYADDNGCSSSVAYYNVFVNASTATPHITTLSGTYCVGSSYNFAATPVGGTWSTNNVIASITSSNTSAATAKINSAGSFGVIYNTAADVNGCKATTTFIRSTTTCILSTVVLDTLSGSLEAARIQAGSVSVYPNPARGVVTLNVPSVSANSSFSIADITGKIVKTQVVTDKQTKVNVSNLKSGIYFISIQSAEGKTMKKLIINN